MTEFEQYDRSLQTLEIEEQHEILMSLASDEAKMIISKKFGLNGEDAHKQFSHIDVEIMKGLTEQQLKDKVWYVRKAHLIWSEARNRFRVWLALAEQKNSKKICKAYQEHCILLNNSTKETFEDAKRCD